ncbi:hypothetical protein OGAPHI_000971 [Ogataea philodendri]|uniref:Cell wall mannoprotein PIR1-like C-terminal domain-containing protein n=1 Tax=Ogataea philodendri TaxID=1378263 RepID=A0A9P8T938_9ASCO|nr:uncharacterized protein OGAPHI_000971 [Ogataea philodendri]KAH3670456.1 hypothetical protein OGAPHI_000971 [Ogataea philodendri]
MKFSSSLAVISLASNTFAAYVGSTYWTTLTPSATLDAALTSYSATFGIAVEPISSASAGVSSLALKKRQVVSQIGDGQIQASTNTEAETSTTASEEKSTAAAVVSQITDGQIQATTSTSSSSSSSAKKTDAAVVTQIGDGQIQATTATPSASSDDSIVTQIGDGQIQADTTSSASSSTSTAADVVSQISDGQVQASTSTTSASKTTSGVASQISDGQVQASTTASATSSSASSTSSASGDYVDSVSCYKTGALAITLKDGVLYDSEGRIGSIVANHQVQFDGPPPQAGAIYAAGWGISSDGFLAIGNNTEFYQCLSGTFYNLYDEYIGDQCTEVHLKVVELVSC